MAGSLAGKLALVTGAGSGLGSAIARQLAAAGATIVAVDINKRSAAALLQQLPHTSAERPHVSLQCDVSSADFVDQLQSIVQHQYQTPVDCLVNNAGVTKDAQLHDMTLEQWEWVIQVNLRAAWLLTRAFTRDMLPGGSVINISSIVGKTGNFGQTNYAASKAGLIGLTKAAAIELARKEIRVNAVLPGYIETPMTSKLPDKARDRVLAQIPLRRYGQPADVAAVVEFLADPAKSGYITGSSVEVAGGLGA